MNERIRELAEQAGYDIKPFYKSEDDYQIPHYKDEQLEKFAELIVRECAKQCDPEPGIKYSPNAVSSRQDCKEKILQLLN